MEAIFSMLYASKDFPDVYRKKPGRRPKSFIEIDDFLVLTMRIFHEVKKHATKSNSHNLYKKLAHFLENNDAIISLNYDTLIDTALMDYGWDAKKGYGLKSSPQNFRGFSTVKKTEHPCLVKLFKLHGSLNWFTRKKKSESLSVLFTKKPSCILSPQNLRWKEKSGYIRQIIPPIYGKFFAHNFWQSLWTKAFDSLISCDNLIVIGLSLVPTDFHLRSLFGRVKTLRKIKNNPFKKVTIVNPNSDVMKEFKHILRGCKQRFIHISTFEKFIKQFSSNKA